MSLKSTSPDLIYWSVIRMHKLKKVVGFKISDLDSFSTE